jgi:transposase
VTDVADGFDGEIEIVHQTRGYRRWPDDVRSRIVAESFQPGVRVSDVARRQGLASHRLSDWRSQALPCLLALPAEMMAGDVKERDMEPALVPVFGVVPANEGMNPGARSLDVWEATSGPGRDVLAGPEEGFGEGIVVRYPRPAEGRNDAETLHGGLHGGALHRAAVVGMLGKRAGEASTPPPTHSMPAPASSACYVVGDRRYWSIASSAWMRKPCAGPRSTWATCVWH